MIEPFQKSHWPAPEKRVRSLSLSLLFFILMLFAASWLEGNNWTIRIGLDYLPREISISAYEIPSDLVQFSLGLPNYAFGEIYIPETVLPPDWFYPVSLSTFFLAFSLLAVGISYFEGIWLYASLFLMAAGVALFEPGFLIPSSFLSSKWITGLMVLFITFPVFAISTWLSQWNMARRWWVLLTINGIAAYLFFNLGIQTAIQSKFLAGLILPVLFAAIVFIFLNATDVLHGVLILLTRGSGNFQSSLHFSVFAVFYLANFLLIYLKNTGSLVLDIFYPDPFLMQIFSLFAGFWVLSSKESLGNGDSAFGKGLFCLYSSLAVCFLLAGFIGFGSANDLVTEVLEDGITLIHFCMGLCFFLYVFINFFGLMRHGLRVHEVLFSPRYMPVSGIAVFGIGGVLIFLLNSGYFTYYQAIASRYVYLGDHARQEGKALMAEEMYRQALMMESRNRRANLSLAVLYLESGNFEQAVRTAENSLEKNPAPEAMLVMAHAYHTKGQNLDEILCLQDAIHRFPDDGRILNNAGMAFMNTIYKDSARFYLSKAVEVGKSKKVAKTNLGFYHLVNGGKPEGSPAGPDDPNDGDWAAMSNQMVFANAAHENSGSVSQLIRGFKDVPDEIKPFLLYHAILNKAINRDSTGTMELIGLEDDSVRKYYGEAIQMAKALLQYRCGKVYSGMDNLLYLYESGTHNRLDFSLLLGQLFYEQGAFASSAEYFKKAASAGLKNAWYWYAVACLDAGQKDESLTALREAYPYLSPGDKVRVSLLADGIGKTSFSQVAKRTDPEKSVYIKLNWNQITEQQLKDLIHLTSDPESRRFLWKYAYERAYKGSNIVFCRSLYRYGQDFMKKDKKWQEMLAEFKAYHIDLVSNQSHSGKALNTMPAFLRGRNALEKKENENAVRFFNQALQEEPFNSRNACLAVKGIMEAGKKDMAYQKALDLTRLDASNPDFLSLYAEIALRNGLADFAFQCLPKLEVLAGPQKAAALKSKMSSELQAKGLPIPKDPIP